MDVYSIENCIKRGKTVILALRQASEETSTVRQWTDKDTVHLMSLMKEFAYEFGNPKRRKKQVWSDVAKKSQELTDAFWTPEDCRKKWSNLIRTFKVIEEQKRNENSANKKTKWQFHEQMYEILSADGIESLPEVASVLPFVREFPLENNAAPTQAVYQGGTGSESDIVPTLSDLGIHATTTTTQGSQAVAEAVDTQEMQFYIVDNNDGAIRSGGDETTVTFTASTEDFQTLASVAAAAAANNAIPANSLHPSSSLTLPTSHLKPADSNTIKQVKFTDQVIAVPSSSSGSLLAIPANINSTNGLATVVSIPMYTTGQLQQLQPRAPSNPVSTMTITNPGRSDSESHHVDQVIPLSSTPSALPNVSSSGTSNNSVVKLAIPSSSKKRKISREPSRRKTLDFTEDETTGDPLVDKFIAISNRQNERILERMEKFQQETLQVMRERNKLLENMLEFLKSQATSDAQGSSKTVNVPPDAQNPESCS